MREIPALLESNHEVHLVAPHADEITTLPPSRRHALPNSMSRVNRVTVGQMRALRTVLRLRPDAVHIHDPELIPAGWVLRLSGMQVVYDAHEDFPAQFEQKEYLSRGARWAAAPLVRALMSLNDHVVSGVICATPDVAIRHRTARNRAVIANYPDLQEYDLQSSQIRDIEFIYVGAISEERGVLTMVEALSSTAAASELTLTLGGEVTPAGLCRVMEESPGWERVTYLGQIPSHDVASLLCRSQVGLVVLNNTPRYLTAYPTKLFEYMAAGCAFISSDFPIWRELASGVDCGLFIRPQDPVELAEAMLYLRNNPQIVVEMGARGRWLSEKKYSWRAEAQLMRDFYDRLPGQIPKSLPA